MRHKMKRSAYRVKFLNHRFLMFCLLFMSVAANAQEAVFVAPNGNDAYKGTIEQPLKNIETAIQRAEQSGNPEVRIYLREGVYYLTRPLDINAKAFREKTLLISAYQEEQATVSGGRLLPLKWEKNKKGQWEASTEFTDFDQLFVNGKKRILARYPNYVENAIFNGTSKDVLAPSRTKQWKHPEGGFIHAMHSGQWGDMHYIITGKKGTEVLYEGGFQNNRPSSMHKDYRFVENIQEELDAPSEWFLNKREKRLYYIPIPDENENMKTADIEVAVLPHLIKLTGTLENPLRHVTLQNIRFIQTKRTFMEMYEPLMRSDWCIYRGAAIMLENTENCSVKGCEFTDLGGNALFMSRYNFNDTLKSNYIHHIGASAICVVGDTSAVRSGSLRYELSVPYKKMDKTPGPANRLYPRECLVEDNLIHHIGQVEKQTAGVEIQLASRITVRHNSIYQVPRAGINVGDGAFGGHLIEYNDVFETVLETSDHGAFNSWGRDRFWHPNRTAMDHLTTEHPELILLDALYTSILRNNRFRCDHGWDIDLDDGSSNYHIYNNVCLQGGIKLREGFYRTVENNIMVNNSFHPHVWFTNSGDVFQRNILMHPYYPISLNGWGKSVDYNFFASEKDLAKAQGNKTDAHSVSGQLYFTDGSKGDYTLCTGSEAFKIGYENFPMNRFGVYSPKLRLISKQPAFPELVFLNSMETKKEAVWMEGSIRVVDGLGDRSAYGLPDEKGIIITQATVNGLLARSGLQKGDVIRSVQGEVMDTLEKLFAMSEKLRWTGEMKATIFRNQKESEVLIKLR